MNTLIGFSTNYKNKGSAAIRFFTRSWYSHCFVHVDYTNKPAACLESHLEVRFVPFNKWYERPEISYELYEILGITEELKRKALAETFNDLAGDSYGWFQGIWFIYRWAMEGLGLSFDTNKNWFTNGVLCSELQWYFLESCGLGHLVKHLNPDTVQAADLRRVVLENPGIFRKVKARNALT